MLLPITIVDVGIREPDGVCNAPGARGAIMIVGCFGVAAAAPPIGAGVREGEVDSGRRIAPPVAPGVEMRATPAGVRTGAPAPGVPTTRSTDVEGVGGRITVSTCVEPGPAPVGGRCNAGVRGPTGPPSGVRWPSCGRDPGVAGAEMRIPLDVNTVVLPGAPRIGVIDIPRGPGGISGRGPEGRAVASDRTAGPNRSCIKLLNSVLYPPGIIQRTAYGISTSCFV